MPDDKQTTATIDARSAVAASGDTPRPSDVQGGGVPLDSAPDGGLKDAAGEVFNPAKHAVDHNGSPRLAANGNWRRKTGWGAVKFKGGKIPTQAELFRKKSPAPTKPKSEPVGIPSPGPAPVAQGVLPGGSSFNPPPPMPTAGETGTVDAEKIIAEPLTPDQCKATATAITDGAIGMARMVRGEHWAASATERTQLVDCLSRLWALYNLPRFGPIVELMMLLVSFIFNGEKRREDMQKLWRWAIGKKIEPAPEQVQPAQ